MYLDGTTILQLNSESANDYAAVWSPDNKHIAFVSDRVGGKRIYSLWKKMAKEFYSLLMEAI